MSYIEKDIEQGLIDHLQKFLLLASNQAAFVVAFLYKEFQKIL